MTTTVPRRLTVSTVDYHTAGEPFRIVTGGVPALRGDTMLARRDDAAERLDHYRRLLVFEPRGHADMYGGFVTPPRDADAHLGVVFFHNAGYSTACGHGTIALATWAIDSGLVAPAGTMTTVVIDVPSGRVTAEVDTACADAVGAVRFRNVPAYVEARAVPVNTSAGTLEVDLAYGGAFYACLPAAAAGLAVTPACLPRLIALGREIQAAVETDRAVAHPDDPRLRGVYGVIFFEQVDDVAGDPDRGGQPGMQQRNVTVFADGEVDRSPCGSGTSARLALLDESGDLPRGATLVHRSIVGTRFEASVVGTGRVAGRPAVITEVVGRSAVTGYHHFVLRPDDEVGVGFLLR
jgi:proline racemase